VKTALPDTTKRKLSREGLGERKLRTKVHLLFRKAFGSRAERLLFFDFTDETPRMVRKAFRRKLVNAKADDVGFHIWDWREDAAFVVALNLFPEKFSAAEIREGIDWFAAHAPYHVNGVAELLDYSTKAPSESEEKPKTRKVARQGDRK
jgi:hypothetical protein